MCRLYVFRSTENSKVECTLVHAQNALMAQSRRDTSGYSHAHGWGVATYNAEQPAVEKKAWAAYHGEHFARAAARIYTDIVVAHVRRATIGGSSIENTHPFTSGRWIFAHNGTVPLFDRIKPKLLNNMPEHQKNSIRGQTDSEHLFYYALVLLQQNPELELKEVIRMVARNVIEWVNQIDNEVPIGLNLVMTDGDVVCGTRLGRSLYSVTRNGVYDCEICGFPHIHHSMNRDYRAVVVASEPITHEDWQEIPEKCLWHLTDQANLMLEAL